VRDSKELLRALLKEVIVFINKDEYHSHLTLRWRRGAVDEIDLDLPRRRFAAVRTHEDRLALVRRLAVQYPGAVTLNRRERTTACGHRFIANHPGNLPPALRYQFPPISRMSVLATTEPRPTAPDIAPQTVEQGHITQPQIGRVYSVFSIRRDRARRRHSPPLDACNSAPMAASNSCLSKGFSKRSRPPSTPSYFAAANSCRPVINMTGRAGRKFLMIC
jgi:hypothetical protein